MLHALPDEVIDNNVALSRDPSGLVAIVDS